ncbi:MAG: hypothetical protein FWD73_17190 [Polyangiaceae bacterium]|nr:hypothetical protein [Polyangiaceae bacterium]
MKRFSQARWLVAVGCLASCGGAFGDAPGSSGSDSSDGGASDQTNGGDAGSDGGGHATLDGGVVDPGTTFWFEQAKNLWVYVQQGQSIDIPITVTRYITPGTDITIQATSQPDGVTVDPLTILAGATTGQLTVKVGASVPQGLLNVALQGSAAGATATTNANLQLFVITGKPGTLDTSFAPASGGVIEDTIDYFTISIRAVTSQIDGKILIGGTQRHDQTASYTSSVIRLNADGLVDKTLSSESDIQNIPGGLYSVAAYPDGRIVTFTSTGSISTTSNISRYTANGAFDTTLFDTNSLLPAGWTSFSPAAVVVGPDDSVYAGGSAYTPSGGSFTHPYAFLHVPTDGQGRPGCAEPSWNNINGSSESINKLSLLPTGALVFAGGTNSSGSTTDGAGVGVGRCQQPQSSCETNGVWSSTTLSYFSDALFDTDESVYLLTGASSATNSLVHIDPTGKLVAMVTVPFYIARGITRAPDGRYLVAGRQQASNSPMAVAYYNSDLTLDKSIGDQGVVTIPIPASTTLTNPNAIGLRAVYMSDGSRTVVVGGIFGVDAVTKASVYHLVVARIWN